MDFNKIIAQKNLSKRDLSKLKDLVMLVQPNNGELVAILDNYIYYTPDVETLNIMEKTISALFQSLDYPTEEWAIENKAEWEGYNYAKKCITEYCLTETKNIDIIVDNIAFSYNVDSKEVVSSIVSYMTNFGDSKKINNAFHQYSNDLNRDIRNYNKPEGFIPVYSKAIVTKIKEMQMSKSSTKNF